MSLARCDTTCTTGNICVVTSDWTGPGVPRLRQAAARSVTLNGQRSQIGGGKEDEKRACPVYILYPDVTHMKLTPSLPPLAVKKRGGECPHLMEAYPGMLPPEAKGKCIRPARAEASDGEQLDSERGRPGLVGLGLGLGCSIVDHMRSSTHDELGMWAVFVLLLSGVRAAMRST